MKATRVIFVVAMVLGVLWNCLCLVGAFPFALWRFSFTIVAFGTIWVLLPRVVRGAERSPMSRHAAGFVVVWYVVWVITVVACLVYPM
jgi:dolichol kinase